MFRSGGRRDVAPLFRRSSERASRPYNRRHPGVRRNAAPVAVAAPVEARRPKRRARRAVGGGGGALPRRGAAAPRRSTRAHQDARALPTQRAKRHNSRGPTPRREARQNARTHQRRTIPPRTTTIPPDQTRQRVGRAGAAASRCPVGGAAAPAARRASRDSRGHYAASRAGITPRAARALRREPRGHYAARRAGITPRAARALRREPRGHYAASPAGITPRSTRRRHGHNDPGTRARPPLVYPSPLSPEAALYPTK